MNTLKEIYAQMAAESEAAYGSSPFSSLSRDYFARINRNPEEKAITAEIELNNTWKIMLPREAGSLTRLMADHLKDFLYRSMQIKLGVEGHSREGLAKGTRQTIVLLDAGGGDSQIPESFTITVLLDRIIVAGRDPEGLRDGIVGLVDRMGLRQAPILTTGEQVFRPRLAIRLGAVPWLGSYRETVFSGYNAVLCSDSADLFTLSVSEAIPELVSRRNHNPLPQIAKKAREARQYGLKTYIRLGMMKKFPKDDLIFRNHPDIRGALTWGGEYVLCTEHPLVRRYLSESVAGIFRTVPELSGIIIIIGGESFYHCFMRSYGTAKGHTNCPRCEKMGSETVVSNLCNYLVAAAREVNPNAEVVAWPYSAYAIWSQDIAQTGFIKKLKPGTAILTEIEKDEHVEKPEGFKKHLWDYSIDLIGPGDRAKQQIALCREAGIHCYLKSEPEISTEVLSLSHIPCLDRWLARAEALAGCGAKGAWVFPAFRPNYGTSASEVSKYVWWEPHPEPDEILLALAGRIAGRKSGPHLRKAWKLISEVIPLIPEIPSYYVGPYYLGPAHPMCADPQAEVPKIFYGQLLFNAENTEKEGLKFSPAFVTSPTGDVLVFGRLYRRMEKLLREAVQEVDQAESLVPERNKLTFQAEVSAIRFFYHTVRTEANFYESCQLRDRLIAAQGEAPRGKPRGIFAESCEAKNASLSCHSSFGATVDPPCGKPQGFLAKKGQCLSPDIAEAYSRWLEVMKDEEKNDQAALPVMETDVRLDFYYRNDHKYAHGADMIRAKLDLIKGEINQVLPGLAERCGIPNPEG